MANKRPFKTVYFNKRGIETKVGRACTLYGALRGATMKIHDRLFYGAQISLDGEILIDLFFSGKDIVVKYKKNLSELRK